MLISPHKDPYLQIFGEQYSTYLRVLVNLLMNSVKLMGSPKHTHIYIFCRKKYTMQLLHAILQARCDIRPHTSASLEENGMKQKKSWKGPTFLSLKQFSSKDTDFFLGKLHAINCIMCRPFYKGSAPLGHFTFHYLRPNRSYSYIHLPWVTNFDEHFHPWCLIFKLYQP